MHIILQKPILTEKSLRLAQKGCYTFATDKNATKHAIAQAVHDQFQVDVVRVHTLTMKGKTRRVGRLRKEVKGSEWKKAVIQLKPEQKIALFDVS